MKKLSLLILLISSITYSQKDTFTFYTGLSKSFGAEIMLSEKLGFGFAGTNENSKGIGDWKSGQISKWDNNYKINAFTQKWFTIYTLVSFGYFKNVKVSYLIGGALYGRKVNFNYNGFKYHKDENIFLKPIIGIDFSKDITKDFGIKIGLDTFNYIKLGANVYF